MINTYSGLDVDDSFSISKFLVENEVEILGISDKHKPRQFFFYLHKNVINYVIEGQKRMYTGKKIFTMKKGDILFSPAGSYLFSDITRNAAHFRSANILLDERLFNIKSKKGPGGSSSARNFGLLKNWLSQLQVLPGKDIELCNLLPVVHRVSDQLPARPESSQDEKHFKTIINRHLIVCSKLPDFACACNMSLATFKRYFKAAFSVPPKHWIREKKLEIADFYLKTQNISVTDACFKSGFEDVSHFIQLYKKQFGITPKQSSFL